MHKTMIFGVVATLALAGCKDKQADNNNKDKKPAQAAKVVTPAKAPTPKKLVPKPVTITSTSPQAVALYQDGRTLQENFRMAEATAKYQAALKIDPQFALAHANLGSLNKGSELGETHFKQAETAAAKLPAAEKAMVNYYVATHRKEKAAAGQALLSLVKAAPADWRVQMLAGRSAQQLGEPKAARIAFERAAELNPKAPYPHNNLAYIYAAEKNWDEAIEHAKRYATLSPGEANPLDSKGEILLMAGRLAESSAAYQEALKVAPTFSIAHQGIAATKLYAGDIKGAISQYELQVKSSERPVERYKALESLAWAHRIAGDDKAAQKALKDVAKSMKEAGIKDADTKLAQLETAFALDRKDYKAATKHAKRALALQTKAGVDSKAMRWSHVASIVAAAHGGNVKAAETELAALTSEKADDHYVHYAAGHVALAKGDFDAANASFTKLHKDAWFGVEGKLLSATALAKAGKAELAKPLFAEVAKTYKRAIYNARFQRAAAAHLKGGHGH